jgi:hypothetical protein
MIMFDLQKNHYELNDNPFTFVNPKPKEGDYFTAKI